MLINQIEEQYNYLKEVQRQHDLKEDWDDEDWAFDEVLNHKIRECIIKMYGGVRCS